MIFPPLGKNRERAPASIYIIDSDNIIDAPISPLKINRLIYSGHVATFPVLNFHEKSDGNHDFGRFMRPRVSRGRRLVNTGGTTQNASIHHFRNTQSMHSVHRFAAQPTAKSRYQSCRHAQQADFRPYNTICHDLITYLSHRKSERERRERQEGMGVLLQPCTEVCITITDLLDRALDTKREL